MDNARYQHCRVAKEFAQTLDIHSVFLPPYSPNLNIIERLWEWVKKKCLYTKYYENFDDFTKAIETSLEEVNTLHQAELESLLSLKFQSSHKS